MEKKYFIRTKATPTGGEVGHIFEEVPNVYMPPGFVAYTDSLTDRGYIEIHPSNEVKYISQSQYERIASCILEDRDATQEVSWVLRELEAEKVLMDKLEAFQDAARALVKAWGDIAHDSPVEDLLTRTYPFNEDFEEVEAKIHVWGAPEE